ncbi:conjugal transfer protein TraI [Algoriphagus sp. Y33]|uniref:conjugal transfer protein TraI n=1 Tax=Algoriphagus sp. Y33 TaxID=2772483 RepID=UPI001CE1BA28|nr:conjugal transfer protein TraI [Algoriphagus sp. Y33]
MNKLVRTTILTVMCIVFTLPPQRSEAAVPLAILEVIKAGVKKVIVAIDLKIQRQQNKVIWMQNAQKVLENTMSKLKLDEISEWTEKQRELYKGYFEELQKVKLAITYYQRVREISQKQSRLLSEYQAVWRIIQQDGHFSPEEKQYMGIVYSGILGETAKSIDHIMLVVQSFTVQMSDAKRLEIINEAADRVDRNYSDLVSFNRENALLSIQRGRTENEVELSRRLYGIR